MSTTQPIRSKQLLHDFKNYYLTEQPEFRNYTIILIGLNTALRINDILHITWGDVYCGERRRFYTHLLITEKKTGKETRILINKELQETLLSYRTTQPSIADTDYLFPSPRKTGSPLSRYQAYRIVRKAAEAVGIEDVIRCHSLRKTFGYHAWKMGTPPALLMEIYNHSSRIRGADFDHRRSDLRVLVDGEHRKSDDTHDDNQYRDDSREYGSVYKETYFHNVFLFGMCNFPSFTGFLPAFCLLRHH